MTRSALVPLALALLGACATPQSAAPTSDPSAVAAEAERQRAAAAMPRSPAAQPSTPAADALGVPAFEAMRRLHTVADAVLMHGAPLCAGKVAPRLGMRVWSTELPNGAPGPDVVAAFGLTTAVSVSSLARGGPAERAGIRAGDVVVSVNGQRLPEGPGALRAYLAMVDEAYKAGGPVAIVHRRAKRELTARVAPSPACAYPVNFVNSARVNALADGTRIWVARGLIDLLDRDEQLALVVGHELAHNVMAHRAAQRANVTAGAIGGLALDIAAAAFGINTGGSFTRLGGMGGARAFSQDFEREADYIGLYFVALAGYDHARAGETWRRLGAAAPDAITYASTHPTTAERFVALEAAAREIDAKKASGEVLRPALKSTPAPAAQAAPPLGR